MLAAILTGVASEGLTARIVKVFRSSDLAALAHVGATLSGSGIAIGLQSRGTTMIQKQGLARLHNLELFPQSPSLTLATYEQIGRNAARYALGQQPTPVPVQVVAKDLLDGMARSGGGTKRPFTSTRCTIFIGRPKGSMTCAMVAASATSSAIWLPLRCSGGRCWPRLA